MAREVKQVTFTKAAIPKLTRVAAYARVSSTKDAMHHSLSAQVSYYSGLIQNHPGWQYVGVYADDTAIMGLNRNQRQSDGCLVPFFLFSEDFSNQMRMYQF